MDLLAQSIEAETFICPPPAWSSAIAHVPRRRARNLIFTLPSWVIRLRRTIIMHLMYTLDEAGNRVYTLKVRRGLLVSDIRLTNSVEGHGCGKDY